MIGKQTKGQSFGGLVNYVLRKDGAERVGGNMLGQTPKELSAEFGEIRKLKPQMQRPVYHVSLSLPHGEHLSDTQWNDVAKKYLNEMGFGKSQYVAVRHRDTKHDHIHIVANRIGMDGKVVSESHDYKRSEAIIRGLEIEHNLTRVLPSRETQRRSLTSGELNKIVRTGEPSTKLRLQHFIDQAAQGKPTMSDFSERLQSNNVEICPYQSQSGHISGIRFSLDGQTMKGSNLGRAYTWHGLQQKKGITYDQNRDSPAISRATDRFTSRAAIERFTNRRNLLLSRGQDSGERANRHSELRVPGRTVGRDAGENDVGNQSRLVAHERQRISLSRGISALRQGISGNSAKNSGHLFQTQAQGSHHVDGIDPLNLGRSYERVLRVGALFERESGREPVEDLSNQDPSRVQSKRPKVDRKSNRVIREALKPFDDEKKRIEKERDDLFNLEREKTRALEKEKGLGDGIGL